MVGKKVEEKFTPEYGPREKWRIIKNLFVMGMAFMLLFTAFHGAGNLQSSINTKAGLGTITLACVFVGPIFSGILFVAPLMKWLNAKWTVCLTMTAYIPFIAVQLWPRVYTMIPAGLVVGLGSAPMFCAKCIYLNMMAEVYGKITNTSANLIFTRFLAVFFMLFHLNQIWGNLISSLVLSSGGNKAAVTALNSSQIPEMCGANFLPTTDANKALQPQPPEKIQMLVGIFLACMVGAVLIVAIGVDSVKRYDSSHHQTRPKGMRILTVALKLFKEPNELLMVLLTLFLGYQQAFFVADISAAFVSCTIGPGSVGFVMMAHGVADIFGCATTAYIIKVTGRIPLMVGAGIINAAMLIFLISWRPQAESGYVLYIISTVWGLCNSVWLVQINAYHAHLFPGKEEIAFSNFRSIDAVGYVLALSTSNYLRTRTKLYLQLSLLILGLICYFITEYRERVRKKEEDSEGTKKNEESGCDNFAFRHID